MSDPHNYPILRRTTFQFPAIDNHAHPLLKEEHRDAFTFEGLVSEAQGSALTNDSTHTLSSLRARKEVAKLYGLDPLATTWDQLKEHRKTIPYTQLTEACFQPTKIQCLLLDDGLGGVEEVGQDYQAHDTLTRSPSKRIVRIEVVAEVREPLPSPPSHKIYFAS